MPKSKWIKLDDLRQPGMRRALEAISFVEREAMTLLSASASGNAAFHQPEQNHLSEVNCYAEG